MLSTLHTVLPCHRRRHCREQYPPGVRHALWLMAEMAIIGSDIQEVRACDLCLCVAAKCSSCRKLSLVSCSKRGS